MLDASSSNLVVAGWETGAELVSVLLVTWALNSARRPSRGCFLRIGNLMVEGDSVIVVWDF